jgi:hypothetical protein
MIGCAQHTHQLETYFACCPLDRRFRCAVCGETFLLGPDRAEGDLLRESAALGFKVSLN